MKYKSSYAACLAAIAIVANVASPVAAANKQYRKALPGYVYHFPQDHFSHDEFKTEWWYYTGHLESKDGKRYGYELTFFRTGADNPAIDKKSAWGLDNFYLAHFAVSDLSGKKFYFYEKLNRAALGLAGASQSAYRVHNENWSAMQLGDKYVLKADGPDFAIDLLLTDLKHPVVHGKDGVSQKANCVGCASHYYSMTRLETRGLITDHGKTSEVRGLSWMDHEFGSNQLTEEQSGWDWFSLQLDDNREFMAYLLRRADGTVEKQSSGTIVEADGSARHLGLGDFVVTPTKYWVSPKSKGKYPMGWKLSSKVADLDVTVESEMPDQELNTKRSTGVTYWEGAVRLSGKSKGKAVKGAGYVEMTGYAQKFGSKI